MIISSLSENKKNEKRIAITPDLVKKYINLGFEVGVPKDYGDHLGFDDQSYVAEGAKIYNEEKELIEKSDVIVQLGLLSDEQIKLLKSNQTLVGVLNTYENKNKLNEISKKK